MNSNIISNTWNDCPVCGRELILVYQLIKCMNDGYKIAFSSENKISWEKIPIENIIIIRTTEEFKYKECLFDITNIFSINYDILYYTNKALSIEQIKKLIPLL